ncbi:MAG: CDP-alcohol phosphatidyltransferase family protein [Eubacteriales bacterium]|nr:CDP-alcohol phosphatidyltransferase family protein [Eubacteriales bacterium]
MIGFYNYTVLLTYAGTVSGFLGIIQMLHGNLKWSLVCLLCSGVCDMFDGKIASSRKRTQQEMHFGIQIDSLNDIVCFGILPALIVFRESGESLWSTVACTLYLLCALIRLAWFNVQEEARQGQGEGGVGAFLGLPVTSSALGVPLVMCAWHFLPWSTGFLYPLLLLATGVAFLTPVPLPKPRLVGKLILSVLGAVCFVLVLCGIPS